MGKVVKILLLLLLLVFFVTKIPLVTAAPPASCSVRTEPAELTDETRKAEFIVNIGSGNANRQNYVMEFNCRDIPFLLNQRASDNTFPAQKLNDDEIFYPLDRTWYIPGTTPCQFSEGKNKLIFIRAVISTSIGNQFVDQCTAYYDVADKDNFCKLEFNHQDGLTSSTDLQVSGKNLTANGQFRLFFDNKLLLDPLNPALLNYLVTPEFQPIKIPNSLLSVGRHKIEVRRVKVGPPIPGIGGFGQTLCPLEFTIGPPDKPGKVLGQPGIAKGCTKQDVLQGLCTSGKGLECDPAKPSIKTAIGCIHTNPADLMQDVLKFGVGIGGGLAFLMMLLGAFQMLTSAGNPETLQAGRERLTSAIIGLLVIIFSVLLLQIIGVDILGILER